MNLVRASDMFLQRVSKRLWSDFKLSPAAGMALCVIEGAGEPVPPTVIAERLLVTSGSVTSLLDTLERRGLVTRQRHPGDRRMVLVDLSDEARAIVDGVLEDVYALDVDATATLTAAEQKEFVRLLGKFQANLHARRHEEWPTVEVKRRKRRG